MIKHKREIFLSDSSHRGLVISGVFWSCATIDTLRICIKMQGAEGKGLFIPAVLFAALSIFLLLKGLFKALERRKNAMESRQNFMKNGVVSHGKVTAAGGGYYQKGHHRQQNITRGEPKHFRIWESCWWADIEYYDETEGIYKKRRVINLNKNGGARLIGRDVDLYRLDEAVYVDFK